MYNALFVQVVIDYVAYVVGCSYMYMYSVTV